MYSSYLWALFILISCHAKVGLTQRNGCKATESCVIEEICTKSDDSGRGLLTPRSFYRYCGNGLVCCDKEQLDNYYFNQEQETIGNPWDTTASTSTSTTEAINFKSGDPAAEDGDDNDDYKSCGGQRLCVPRHLCRTGEVNDDGRYIIRPKIDSASNFGCKYFEICCPVNERVEKKSTRLQPVTTNFTYQGCGYSNPKGLYYDLVGFNDNESLFAQYPWMIALMDIDGKYICGGTLIHSQLVLTTAHNVAKYDADSILARAGDWDLNSQRELHPYQTRRIANKLTHEKYNKANFHNDMALLVLEKPFEISPHIQPICLPPVETVQLQDDLLKAQCIATGWGTPSSPMNLTTATLKMAPEEHLLKRIDLPVVEHSQCQKKLRRTILGLRFRLSPSFICAGGVEGKDTCQGDGGSPLFCTMSGQKDRYQLAGLVSWGIECNNKDFPAAYTNVAYLRDWINGQAQQRGFVLPTP
uniref:Phenoloxidase-activating factor 2 n=2 Tax=Drosophila willistoni TaxID=7260 RepID=B4MPN2_DROWI